MAMPVALAPSDNAIPVAEALVVSPDDQAVGIKVEEGLKPINVPLA